MEILRDTPWRKTISIMSLIIGLISLMITLYIEIIRKDAPQLEYNIIAQSDFFNDKDSISYIQILLDDTIDVQKSHQNITTYTIKVENKGTKNITDSEYIKGVFGLTIEDGTLLDIPILLSSSNRYIKDAVKFDTYLKGKSFLEIPKISLDKKDYYLFNLVILHSSDLTPNFVAEGKIIGQQEIKVNTIEQEGIPSFWEITYRGNPLVQLLRVISYFGGVFLIFIVYLYLDDKIDSHKSKKSSEQRERKQYKIRIEHEKRIEKIANTLTDNVKHEYIYNGYEAIKKIRDLFDANEDTITQRYQKMIRFLHGNKKEVNYYDRRKIEKELDFYDSLIKKNFLTLNSDLSLTLDDNARKSVTELLQYLDRQRDNADVIGQEKSIDDILNSQN